MYTSYYNALEELKENSHLRKIRSFAGKDEKYVYDGKKRFLNLSSNNYLGFADNKKITEEFAQTREYAEYSFGSASARLLTGTLPVYNELEELLAFLYQKESALLFNSGYHANIGIASALAGSRDVIFSDKFNHASIIDGMRLSGGKFFRYLHNDMTSLESLLARERYKFRNAVIYTESVFSMDGDIADLKTIIELKKKYDCILATDEAHAFGVFGEKGLGISERLGVIDDIDIIIGTFGKAAGSFGAFAAGSRVLIDFLINNARSFIFSTAIPPVNTAFTKWIIENKFPQTAEKRKKMLELAQSFHSPSQIIPIVIGDNKRTVEMCEILYQNGYFTLPIRPPTVPEGTSRIRLSLTTEIDGQDLEKLCAIIG